MAERSTQSILSEQLCNYLNENYPFFGVHTCQVANNIVDFLFSKLLDHKKPLIVQKYLCPIASICPNKYCVHGIPHEEIRINNSPFCHELKSSFERARGTQCPVCLALK
jgi:hypothetical protein